ncbi:hypothetical protein [Treponema pedis]|uniref:Lipoprotein n=1 Tax=Treponema pedis TaxID=409322 RepID=A0A7S7AXP5_9SPIR|nr:hypothetical protein [Treponema pedis]QOW61396.1 hypothetical protein IFE08_03130 [Treponema pedis]
MKHKNKVSIIGMLIFAIGIIALFSGCSSAYKIQGVWELTGSQKEGIPQDKTLYLCFTSTNRVYKAVKDSSGLRRTEPVAYTVDGNKLKIDGQKEATFVISGTTATFSDSDGTTAFYFKKVSSPTVKEIENAPLMQE